MARVKVQIMKRHGKFMPGDIAEIPQRDLKIMLRMGRAALIAEAPGKAPAKMALTVDQAAPKPKPPAAAAETIPVPKPTPPKSGSAAAPVPREPARTELKRRDITETVSPSVDDLRAKYKRRFHQDPDHRWGIPRLTQELEAAPSKAR